MVSERIKLLANLIPNNSNIADVGCDHGYLIIEAHLLNKFNKALAIDNKKGPLESAQKNITKFNINNVRFSLSSGLNDIDDDTNCIVIAGMGGLLINSIIQEGINKKIVNNNQLFILEANRNCYEVRKFLCENNFEIMNEKIIFEADKFYEIIVCKKTDYKIELTDDEAMFGPILLKEKNDIFKNKYIEEIKKINKIYNGQKVLKEKIERIERICL